MTELNGEIEARQEEVNSVQQNIQTTQDEQQQTIAAAEHELETLVVVVVVVVGGLVVVDIDVKSVPGKNV